MSESTRAHGRLFVEARGLVAKQGTGYLLVNGDGRSSSVEGLVCRDIEESLAISAPTPSLTRLGPAHAALGELATWLGTPSVPLTRLDAVRLGGFDTLFLELLGRCNERCVHCYAESAPTVTDALDRDTVLSVIDQAAALGFRRLQLTGGDPLLCDFLPDAVRHARARAIPFIEIYTNGLALTEELLAELAPERPRFAFSIYSGDPEEHDRITRTPGSHRRTLAAIDRVVARGLDVRAAIIVVEGPADVQGLIDLLNARGVREVGWTKTFAVGRGVEHASASQALVVQTATLEGGIHGSAQATQLGKLCVTYTGDVVPCIFQRGASLGNVRDGSIVDLLTSNSQEPEVQRRGLPIADEVSRRLQCAECRFTERGLAVLRGAR